MISSFFDKTKPINFLVLLSTALLLFWAATVKTYGFQFGYSIFFERLLVVVVLLSTVFFLGNMVKTKKLTFDNSFAMLFFLIMLLLFPLALKNKTILSGFFVLLSMNRAIALKNEKNHKEKIFESALWLYVSSLFNEWSVLFIFALYVAIYLLASKQLRLWLMPIAAFLCIAILSLTTALVLDGFHFFEEHYRFSVGLDFFLKPNYGLMFFLLLTMVVAFLVFGKLGYRRLGRTLSLRLIFTYLIISILIILVSGNNLSRNELFFFFPAAIFFANYLETIKKQKFKEIALLICIILPLLVFTLWLVQ